MKTINKPFLHVLINTEFKKEMFRTSSYLYQYPSKLPKYKELEVYTEERDERIDLIMKIEEKLFIEMLICHGRDLFIEITEESMHAEFTKLCYSDVKDIYTHFSKIHQIDDVRELLQKWDNSELITKISD